MKTSFLAAAVAALLAPAAGAAEFVVVNRCDTKFTVVNRCPAPAAVVVVPAAPLVPVAQAGATAQCGCKSVGSTCPSPAFCGGAGCDCGKAAAAGVAAAPFGNRPVASYGTPATTVPTAGTLPQARGRNAAQGQFRGVTYTLAPGAGGSGSTSGCANGRCGTVQYFP